MNRPFKVDLPKRGTVRQTEEGFAFRLGPPFSKPQFILVVSLMVLLFGLYFCLISVRVAIVFSMAIVFPCAVIVAIMGLPGCTLELEITPEGLTLLKQGTPQKHLPYEEIASVEVFPVSPLLAQMHFMDKSGVSLLAVPSEAFRGLPDWVVQSVFPKQVPISHNLKSSPDAYRPRFIRNAIFCFAVSTSFMVWVFANWWTGILLDHVRFNFALWLVFASCFFVLFGLRSVWFSVAKYQLQPVDRSQSWSELPRKLARIALALPPEESAKQYQASLNKKFSGLSKVIQSRRSMTVFMICLCGVWLVLANLTEPNPGKPRTFADTVIINVMIVGFTAAFGWLDAMYEKRIRRVFAGDSNTFTFEPIAKLNGEAIESVSFLHRTILRSSLDTPKTPHVVTAGGRTYRLNLADFEPIPEPVTEPVPEKTP